MHFTLVSTLFNEITRLEQTISDLSAQTLQPSEIILTDAGSTDGTYERLLRWKSESSVPITILLEKGCNVARGRNLAIQASKYELIVSTDFGCRFHPKWIESLVTPFTTESPDSEIKVVGGAFSVLEENINTLAAKADYNLQRGYPVVMDDYFSVSSRSIAYYKHVWEEVGGYPEWLTLAADDTIFWRLVKKMGFKYAFVEKPYVYWGRHKTHKAFAREAFRYGLGDGESRINYLNFWSNFIETGVRYLLFISIIGLVLVLLFGGSNFEVPRIIWFVPLIFLPGLRSYFYAWRNWRSLRSDKYNLGVFLNSLLQLEMSRFMYLRGYIRGLLDGDEVKKEGRKRLWKVLG